MINSYYVEARKPDNHRCGGTYCIKTWQLSSLEDARITANMAIDDMGASAVEIYKSNMYDYESKLIETIYSPKTKLWYKACEYIKRKMK
jgi:hypothetical protein